MSDLVRDILRPALAPPSEAALQIMRLSLLDWLAVGLAGQNEPVACITRDMVLAEGGQGAATLFGGARGPARGVALANGAASHALDYDDTHFAHIGHPSVAVLPAAMAVAEAEGKGQDAMLSAALAGCEASIRFGLAFGRGHYQVGYHQTATAGAFGATVAAARLLSDDEEVMHQALGLVSTRASGLKSQFGTMGKPYNAGIAASNGVETALLTSAGFLSSDAAIDGPLGFLETHHCDGIPDTTPGFLMESVSHKFHACCHGLHATLEALSTLTRLNPAKVQAVEIRTHPRWMSVCNKPAPKTGLEAKFSYRAVTAFTLLGHDTARLDTYRDALCHDADALALMGKVQVIADEQVSETAAKVSVQTPDGTLEASHDLAAPMPLDVRATRLRGKAEALLGAGRAEALWQAIHGPDDDLARLTQLMT